MTILTIIMTILSILMALLMIFPMVIKTILLTIPMTIQTIRAIMSMIASHKRQNRMVQDQQTTIHAYWSAYAARYRAGDMNTCTQIIILTDKLEHARKQECLSLPEFYRWIYFLRKRDGACAVWSPHLFDQKMHPCSSNLFSIDYVIYDNYIIYHWEQFGIEFKLFCSEILCMHPCVIQKLF